MGHYEQRRERFEREQQALDKALSDWIMDESGHNARQLYLAGCAYLGIKPDEHPRVTDCDPNELAR